MKLNEVFFREIAQSQESVSLYISGNGQHLRVKERVFFHLVESEDSDASFAFLATYTTRDESGRIRHMPLRYALTEYKQERAKLLELLSCLSTVSKRSEFIGEFMRSGELFHPLRVTSEEAYRFLKDVPAIEDAGVVCRIPNWWRRKTDQVNLTVTIRSKKPPFLGLASIVGAWSYLTVDGQELTEEEITGPFSTK